MPVATTSSWALWSVREFTKKWMVCRNWNTSIADAESSDKRRTLMKFYESDTLSTLCFSYCHHSFLRQGSSINGVTRFSVNLTLTLSCQMSSQKSYARTLPKWLHKLMAPPPTPPTKPQENELPPEGTNVCYCFKPKQLPVHTILLTLNMYKIICTIKVYCKWQPAFCSFIKSQRIVYAVYGVWEFWPVLRRITLVILRTL
jgi:hypothetical protein